MAGISEDVLVLMQIAIVIIGILSIFLMFIYYNVTINLDAKVREAYILGDALLANKCLADVYFGDVVKGLFVQEKLDQDVAECIDYPNGLVKVELLDNTESWEYELGPSGEIEKEFFVAVKLDSGETKPAKLVVSV